MSASVLVVEHARDCPPALLGGWLEAAGCTLDVWRPYAGDAEPRLAAYDGLVVLGGPMGAGDDARHGWLTPLKAMVRDARDRAVPTLGICLGHQVIATALGGRVERNPRGQQLGLLETRWTDAAAADDLLGPLATPRRGVQWNDDLVTTLPEGAVVLAQTAYGEVQAVRFGPAMWGLQLHPEVDEVVLEPWAHEDRDRHLAAGVDGDALLADVRDARAELEAAWRPLADGFAALVR